MTLHTWQFFHHTLRDRAGIERRVSVALPDQILHAPTVVYCADGQVVETLCRYMASCEIQNPPILIGVHSNEATRAQGYLFDKNRHYLAHEEFFVDELPTWANTEYDVAQLRSSTVVFGFSNGGAFALTAALRHPASFAAAFSFSTPKLSAMPCIKSAGTLMPSIYLATGNIGPEKSIRKNVLHLARWLRKLNIPVTLAEKNAGHTLDFWASELPIALDWFRETTT